MEREQIISKLTEISREVFQDNQLVIKEDMSATNVDAWTSLTFMQLLTAIEHEFNFRFKMLEVIKLKNIGDIINSIELHTK